MDFLIAIWDEATKIELLIIAFLLFIGFVNGLIKIPKWAKLKKKSEEEPCFTCPDFPSLRLLVIGAIDKMAQVQFIQLNSNMDEQMNEFDDLFVDFKKIFKSGYMSLFRKKTKKAKSGILKERDVQHYISILDGMESELKGMSRGFLKKNHYTQKSEEEFRLYIQDRTEDYQNKISEIFDEKYDSDVFLVSREDLYEYNLEYCKMELLAKAEKFFYKVRDIARENNKKIKKLESGIKDFV